MHVLAVLLMRLLDRHKAKCSSIVDVSKAKQQAITTISERDTERFGEGIGARLRGGEVLQLNSDVGGGKTTLVRGIARGAGSSDVVASPTFTVSKLYRATDFQIVHFDFYRIQSDVAMVCRELEEVISQDNTVVLIEWSDAISNVLPDNTINVTIQPVDDATRRIVWFCPSEYDYLFKGVDA